MQGPLLPYFVLSHPWVGKELSIHEDDEGEQYFTVEGLAKATNLSRLRLFDYIKSHPKECPSKIKAVINRVSRGYIPLKQLHDCLQSVSTWNQDEIEEALAQLTKENRRERPKSKKRNDDPPQGAKRSVGRPPKHPRNRDNEVHVEIEADVEPPQAQPPASLVERFEHLENMFKQSLADMRHVVGMEAVLHFKREFPEEFEARVNDLARAELPAKLELYQQQYEQKLRKELEPKLMKEMEEEMRKIAQAKFGATYNLEASRAALQSAKMPPPPAAGGTKAHLSKGDHVYLDSLYNVLTKKQKK